MEQNLTQDQAQDSTSVSVPRGTSYNLFYVDPKAVDIYWKSLDFREALSHTHMRVGKLRELIKEGKCDLFLARNQFEIVGGMVVRINKGIDEEIQMEIVCAAGQRMNEWIHDLWEQTEEIAKKLGCKRIYIYGRPGWEKLMKPKGFEKVSITLEKELW